MLVNLGYYYSFVIILQLRLRRQLLLLFVEYLRIAPSGEVIRYCIVLSDDEPKTILNITKDTDQ